MTALGERRFRPACWLALLVLSTACGRLYDYPEQVPEDTLLACSDGRDTDLDGKADCDDPSCDGFCPEASESECRDRRDNDGDGLLDAADPRCWRWSAPDAERCAGARGAEIFDDFDAPSLDFENRSSSWAAWSTDYNRPRSQYLPGAIVLGFSGRSRDPGAETQAPSLEANLAAVVRQRAFSGSWQDFELSFTVSVPPRALLRAAIVPMALAPTVGPPVADADGALLALTLDASHVPPTLALTVEGETSQLELPFTNTLCGGTLCFGYPRKLRVGLDALGFRASLAYADGSSAELRARAPSSLSLPPSRLVFWGGSPHFDIEAEVDDLHMSVKPEWPCGFPVPQIPGRSCELAAKLGAFGQSVSVARGVEGEYCALVAASVDARSAAESLTAWRSRDGERWSAASALGAPPVELPAGAELVGAGIAADDAGWHAAVAYREQGAVQLGFMDGSSCDDWSALRPGPVLADDAEAPSYVVTAGRRDVYFTRPGQGNGRSLWRIARDGPNMLPERVAELPPDVAAPVSVALASANDLVLTYPRPAAPGNAGGVGVLVGSPDAQAWPVDLPFVLELPSKQDAPPGQSLAFDSDGVVAAALVWHADGGFLLYSGSSARGLALGSRAEPLETLLAVGSARLAPERQGFLPAAVTPSDRCGDSACSARESCASCAADCPCSGVSVVHDVLSEEVPWQFQAPSSYLGVDPPSLNFASWWDPAWAALPLERAITGDFELSFDLDVGYTLPTGLTCSVYVGLGTTSEGQLAPRSGIFAQVGIDLSCADKFHASPFVVDETVVATAPEDASVCADPQALAMDEWQHVVLRREGSQVTLSTPRSDGCGSFEQRVAYAGALGELPALLVGSGGGAFRPCAFTGRYGALNNLLASHGTITNLELRLPDDPGRCVKPSQRCEAGSAQPSCVDTRRSVEHCGACGNACAAHESCVDGTCTCSDAPGVVECEHVCVDSLVSAEHCGGCGQPCAGQCVGGVCASVGECPMPLELDDPAGGSLTVDLAASNRAARVCERALFSPTLVVWTPNETATAIIELDVGTTSLDTRLGIALLPDEPDQPASSDGPAECGSWLVCNDDAQDLGAGSRLRFPVQANVTYLLGIGLSSPAPDGATAELRIGFER